MSTTCKLGHIGLSWEKCQLGYSWASTCIKGMTLERNMKKHTYNCQVKVLRTSLSPSHPNTDTVHVSRGWWPWRGTWRNTQLTDQGHLSSPSHPTVNTVHLYMFQCDDLGEEHEETHNCQVKVISAPHLILLLRQYMCQGDDLGEEHKETQNCQSRSSNSPILSYNWVSTCVKVMTLERNMKKHTHTTVRSRSSQPPPPLFYSLDSTCVKVMTLERNMKKHTTARSRSSHFPSHTTADTVHHAWW